MPTYHATGITVRLTTTDATLSTSEAIAARTGPQSRLNLERLEAVLDAATVLPEEDVEDNSGDGGLRFVGDAGTPFLLKAVKFGGEQRSNLAAVQLVSEEEITKAMAKRSGVSLGSDSGLSSLGATPVHTPLDAVFHDIHDTMDSTSDDNPPDANDEGTGMPFTANSRNGFGLKPDFPRTQALSLCLKFDPNRSFKRTSYHTTHLDLKIDVFMNGQFISSTRCPATSRNQIQFQTLRFSGLRIDRNIEKAWLLRNSAAVPSGGTENACDTLLAAAQRWCDISAAIKREADVFGFDCNGQRPPVGDYLISLSQEEMPHSVSRLPNRKENKYGVVDVVISMGEGRKFPVTAGYLATPLRMEDKEYGALNGNLILSQKERHETAVRDLGTRQFFDMHPTIEAIRSRLIAAASQPPKNSTPLEHTLEHDIRKPPANHGQDQQPADLRNSGEKERPIEGSERGCFEVTPSVEIQGKQPSQTPGSVLKPVTEPQKEQLLDPAVERDVIETPESGTKKTMPASGHRATRSASVSLYDRSMFEMQSSFGKVVEDLAKAKVKSSREVNRIVIEMGGSAVCSMKLTKPVQLLPRTNKPNPTQHGLPTRIDPPSGFRDAVNGRPMPLLNMPEHGKRRSSSPLKNEIRLLSPFAPLIQENNTEWSTQAMDSSSPIPTTSHQSTMSVTPKRKNSSDKPSKYKKQKIKQEEAAWKKPFDIPELSKDCVITYAAEAAQGLRQCRGERAGEFKEVEVLLGVRFLVAEAEAEE